VAAVDSPGFVADTESSGLSARRRTDLRRASFGAIGMLVVQYGLGIGVNLYVTLPKGDHGHGVDTAISNGPAVLSIHAVVGLLLGLAAIGVLVRAAIARDRLVSVISLVGLLAVAGAALGGARFVSHGTAGASMTMAVLTAVALLAYAANLFILKD
jgi:hypothetical protein